MLVLIVMTEPGRTWPLGVVPTTEPSFAVLLTGVGCSATPNPASLMRLMAAARLRPTTLGMAIAGAPST